MKTYAPYEEWRRVLNPTFVPGRGSQLSEAEADHINVMLDQIQSPLAYINLVQGRPNAVKTDDIPDELGCTLLDKKVRGNDDAVYLTLRRGDVVFSIFRNRKDDEYAFSEREPYIIHEQEKDRKDDPIPFRPVGISA